MSTSNARNDGAALGQPQVGNLTEGLEVSAERLLSDRAARDNRPYMTSVADLDTYFANGHGSFEGYVPISIVERDLLLPIKDNWVQELVKNLEKTRDRDGWGNGQDNPILAAYIISEATPKIEVYDGLHRQAASITFQEEHGIERNRPAEVIAAIGNTAIHFVTLKPMTRHDMLEKRLSNTHNHPELRFARGGLWAAQFWYLDDISKLAPGLSAKQAFNLAERNASAKHSVGKGLGISTDAINQISDWATAYANEWKVDPSTVYKWIHRAESTMPELIAQVRNVGKGSDERGVLTEGMITSITKFMRGEEYFDTQIVVTRFAKEHQLSEVQFHNLLANIINADGVKDPTDINEVIGYLETLDVDTLDDEAKVVTTRRLRRRTDIFTSGGGAIASVSSAIGRVADSLDVRSERVNFVPTLDERQAAINAARELEAQAQRALDVAEEAYRQALQGMDDATSPAANESDGKTGTRPPKTGSVAGFGVVRGAKASLAALEARRMPTTGESLRGFRGALPKIIEDALQGKWGKQELDDALEIATVLAELLAGLSTGDSPGNGEEATHA